MSLLGYTCYIELSHLQKKFNSQTERNSEFLKIVIHYFYKKFLDLLLYRHAISPSVFFIQYFFKIFIFIHFSPFVYSLRIKIITIELSKSVSRPTTRPIALRKSIVKTVFPRHGGKPPTIIFRKSILLK